MFGFKPSRQEREERRYYLLPGMGKANRRKHRLFLKVSVIVGILVSAIVATVLYYANR